MPSFPPIGDLPAMIETNGWIWTRFKPPVAPSDNFWLATDLDGNRWFTKLRGASYAYREIAFAKLAQAMRWSCQSSIFIRVDEQSSRMLGVDPAEMHAAHWFMMEHTNTPCAVNCAFKALMGKSNPSVVDLKESGISHILDWPKSEIAAYLFGGNEPPGRFFTEAHEFVIIDSETMFATGPCEFGADIWDYPDHRLVLEVCNDFAALSDSQIQDALRVPDGVSARKLWSIAPKLKSSRKFASAFIASHKES